MKKLFLFSCLMMLSIVAVAQNEKVGNDLVIKNGVGTVVERVSATENTEMKFDAKGNKLSIKQDGGTKDIALDQVKTISAVPAFRLVSQDKFVYTSTAPITLHFKLTVNDQGEMKPASGESVTFTANKGTLAPITATTNDNGVATVVYTPKAYFWEPGFSDIIQGLYTFTDNGGNVSRYTARTYVEYNGDYTIECLTPDLKLGPNEEAEAIFAVYEVSPSGKKPYTGATIEFSAPEGFISTQSPTTDAFGMARVTFHNDGDDAKEYPVTARFWVHNDNGGLYTGTATAKFITLNYQLEALTPKLAVRNDGSEQDCFFTLYEYHNGKWNVSEKEVEAKFEATGVTLTKTSDMNRGYGFITNFTVGKSFNQGSITAKCDIPLECGKVWQGAATTELVLDDYLFTRISPDGGNPAYVYAEESEDVVFLLTKLVNGQYQFCPGMEVKFECQEGGTLSSTLVKTDADGLATTSFQLNKDEDHATVYVNCSFADEYGIWHVYEEDIEFELTPYRLEPVRKKVAVRNDGSEHSCEFNLYEYKNGQWENSKEVVEVDFEATGVTLSNTSDMYEGHGATATFTAGKSFQEGTVKATCDIQLDNGRVWKGKATVELVPDDYKFSLVAPEADIAAIQSFATVAFTLEKQVNGQYQPCEGHEISFESDGGTFSSSCVKTDTDGHAVTLFTINDDANQANVFARCSFIDENDVYHNFKEKVTFFIPPYRLTRGTPELHMKKSDKKTTVGFQLLERKDGKWVAYPNKKLFFSATNGSVNPDYALTNENGICQPEFIPSEDATEGSVTATTEDIAIQFDDGRYIIWNQSQTVLIIITDDGGGEEPCVVDDPDLQKANQQDNSYVVKNTKTGETVTRPYNPDYSEWTMTPDVIKFQLNDEEVDEQGYPNTKGMLYGFVPLTMRGVVLFLTGQQFENTPGAKVGFGVYDGLYVSTDFMSSSGEGGSMTTEGEIKPDGKSKIMIRKPCTQKVINKSRAPGDEQEDDYTGEYELLYYLVFTTNAYNPETEQSEEVELEVYGKGTMKMHVPSVTSFVARTEKDWVRVGESTKVTLEQYYEEGATWDWNDVQIVGQSTDYSKARNGEDEGFFSWDAATQTLTSLKSNDNKYVWVYLGLKSKPGVKAPVQVATGEGWKYTMIKTSKEEISCKANSYPDFSFDWSPKESENEKMDFNALELDPDCVPAGYFQFPTSYASQGWPVHVSSNCAPGEYTLRFRVKSNHDVNCTMKFVVTPAED